MQRSSAMVPFFFLVVFFVPKKLKNKGVETVGVDSGHRSIGSE